MVAGAIDVAERALQEGTLQQEIRRRMDGKTQTEFARELGVNQSEVSNFLRYGVLRWKMARGIARVYPELKELLGERVS